MNNKTIVLPENSFWKVFKRFGRDEVISMFFNVIGTIVIFKVLKNYYIHTDPTFLFLVSISGPIIEKIGFYPAHFYDAYKVYKTNKLCGYWKQCKIAIKNGSVSLLEDILIHDPVYILLMYIGLKTYSGTPVWMLSFSSFVIAVFIVSFLEVYFLELWYKIFTLKLIKKGYKKETYYETRFIVNSDIGVHNVMENLKYIYNLNDVTEDISYYDNYYDNKLFEFNGRVPALRCRNIHTENIKKSKLEIIYTKTGELKPTELSQYRFFINKRDKFSIKKIESSNKYHDSLKTKDTINNLVTFDRTIYRNPEGLFITLDQVNDKYLVIEIKVFKDTRLLMDAMHSLMNKCNLTLTTHGKNVL
jgi:hypothetical protein